MEGKNQNKGCHLEGTQKSVLSRSILDKVSFTLDHHMAEE